MPNYHESTVTGTSWQRCHTVTIRNPLDGAKKIEFAEERVIALDGEDMRTWVVGCERLFVPGEQFKILNPETNQPTGQVMTHAQLYQALYSLYMQTALERDAATAS